MSEVKAVCRWQDKMTFNTALDEFNVPMDAKKPIGSDSAPTPKQLVLAAICGCTGMDVISLLKKYKQAVETFEIEAEAGPTDIHPIVFKKVKLKYRLQGKFDIEKVKEAVRLSQSKYCGVSAMISKSAPIFYEIFINNEKVADGKSDFL